MVGQKFVLGQKQLPENKNVDKKEEKKTRLSAKVTKKNTSVKVQPGASRHVRKAIGAGRRWELVGA